MKNRFSEDGSSVYKYVFTHHSVNSPLPAWVNSTHEEEIPYVFGLPLNSTYGYTDNEKQLSAKIMRYWTNFAKTGYMESICIYITIKHNIRP